MAVRFLLDENIEHEVRHRLESLGYEATHVEHESALGKGAGDESIATMSRQEELVLVTYDPDFVTRDASLDCFGAVYFDDEDLTAAEVATILDAMAQEYSRAEFQQLQFGGREWL